MLDNSIQAICRNVKRKREKTRKNFCAPVFSLGAFGKQDEKKKGEFSKCVSYAGS